MLELTGLSAAETTELIRAVNPAADPVLAFDRSEGNPLFALEIARNSGVAGPFPVSNVPRAEMGWAGMTRLEIPSKKGGRGLWGRWTIR